MSAIFVRLFGSMTVSAPFPYPTSTRFRGSVDANVVGVVAEFDAAQECQIVGTHYSHRSVRTACDVDTASVDQLVRQFLAAPFVPKHRALDPVSRKVHDPDAVVSEFGDVEKLPFEVDGKMVDPSAHAPSGILRLKFQHCAARLRLEPTS